MPVIHKSALVPYTAQQMFILVEDIDKYPEFLPWCKKTQILSRDHESIHASITLSRAGLEKTFTTRNIMQRDQWLEMRLVRGPFSRLFGRWQFAPLGEHGCKVSLDMDFEFSNRLLRMTLGPIFSHIVNSLVDAFIHRAGELYGNS